MKRQVIQIAATATDDAAADMLYALCDDGTMWELYLGGNKGLQWKEIPDVPQPEEHIV